MTQFITLEEDHGGLSTLNHYRRPLKNSFNWRWHEICLFLSGQSSRSELG